jgi:hypothetical protein
MGETCLAPTLGGGMADGALIFAAGDHADARIGISSPHDHSSGASSRLLL